MTDAPDPASPAPAPGPTPSTPATPPAAPASLPIPPWSSLDASARAVVGSGIALAVITLIGAILGAWESSSLTILLIVAGLVGAGLAWAGAAAALRDQPIPLPAVGSLAALIAVVIAILAVIELVFDFDQLDERGGIIGAILTLAAALAAIAFFITSTRRDPETRAEAMSSKLPVRLALGGLLLVLVGWALSLSVGYWVVEPAIVPVALAAAATALILIAGRIHEWVSWIGAGVAVLAVLMTIGLWGKLMDLGENQIELGIIDIGAFLLAAIGMLLIAAGGVIAALPAGAIAQARAALDTPKPPPAPPAAGGDGA